MKLSEGYLDVGNTHQIYYETYGNPKGVNVLFLHGGPGLGFSENDQRFFDPSIFHVVFMDQRGSGKSTPKGSIEHNTSQHLVDDITLLLDFLNIKKTILFGGSWGGTLSFLFCIKNPHRVNKMLLRGVFPATKRCIDYYEKGETAMYFPDVWKRYIEMVPLEKRNDILGYYLQMMKSNDPKIRKQYAYEMAFYASSICKRTVDFDEIIKSLENIDFESKFLIQAHFSQNDFFIPDNYIYDNLDKVGNIPVIMVHGRYDVVCPPLFAFEYHEKLANSKLYFVDAGHVASEPEIEKKLIEILMVIGKS